MFCSQCGKEIPDDATFCNFCGAQVKEDTPEPQATVNNTYQAAPKPSKMVHCRNCGALMDENATVCPRCGAPVGSVGSTAEGPDEPDTVLNVLSFLIPIVGLILYCVNINKFPKKAKTLGKWALIGFGVSVVIGIIWRAVAVASIANY